MRIFFPSPGFEIVCSRCRARLTFNVTAGEADAEEDYWCENCVDYVDEKKVRI